MSTAVWTALFVIGIKADVRMVLNPGQEPLVEILGEDHVATVVKLHPLPRFRIPFHALHPQLVSLVGHLATDPELLRNMVQLVGREPELLLDDLQKVDLLDWSRRGKPRQKEFPVQVGKVELGAVVMYDHISFVDEVESSFNHGRVSDLKVGQEHNLLFVQPLGCKANDLSSLHELVQTHVHLEQLPHMGKCWATFDIQDKDFNLYSPPQFGTKGASQQALACQTRHELGSSLFQCCDS